MFTPAIDGGEAQPKRLRQHVGEPTGEVQRQQQPLLGQTLETVMAAGAHHVLQAGSVSLAGAPCEPSYRLAPCGWHRGQVPHRAPHRRAGQFPGG